MARSGVAEVSTEAGKVRGFVQNGIVTFRGLPYATAERFMPPQDVEKWQSTRLALSYGNICPQVVSTELREPQSFVSDTQYWPASENCQNLNIWTQAIDDNKKRPVMVWLHGGGFFSGSSKELPLYDGANLVKAGDVVVVTVNHRLNVLGFLDLSAYGEEYKYSANVGMLDIVAALKWVQSNIANFGGDPENVTIFGQSGGGAKVATLMASPSAKGLFHKAIIQSGAPGGAMRTGSDKTVSQAVTERTLEIAGLTSKQVEELKTLSYDDLMAAASKAMAAVAQEKNVGRMSWGPVVDGDFLPLAPFEKAAPVFSKNIPLMVGSTLSEFENINPRLAQRQAWGEEDVKKYLRDTRGKKAEAIYKAYAKAYPELAPRDWLTIDSGFRSGVLHTAGLKAEQGDPVYSYLFAWRSPVLDYAWAAGHSAELSFIFNNLDFGIQSHGGGPVVESLHKQMSKAWINFARNGNPNHSGIPEWPNFTESKPATMVFDAEPDVRTDFDRELINLLAPSSEEK